MSKETNKDLTILKIILWIYIILCFIIAGLNYGYVKTAPESIAKFIEEKTLLRTGGWVPYQEELVSN